MPPTAPRPRRATRPHTAQPLPTTVWLPAPDEPDTAPAPGRVLPGWAIERIHTEVTRRRDRAPEAVLAVSIADTEPGMDARASCTVHGSDNDAGHPFCRPALVLAEFHPNLLPTTGTPAGPAGEMPGALDSGWAGFFHRTHRLLSPEGLLLLATRQHRDDEGVLTDPLGALIACARTAGFRYLQHIVIAHAHPADDRLVPTPPPDASPGVIHSDLIALTAIHHT